MKNSSVFNFEKPLSSENMQLQNKFKLEGRKILYVNQRKGPYRKISEAVKAADPDTNILVDGGLYRENVLINKQNLFIMQFSDNSEIILMGDSKPALTIELGPEEYFNIQGVKITSKGRSKGGFDEVEQVFIKTKTILEDEGKIRDYISRI